MAKSGTPKPIWLLTCFDRHVKVHKSQSGNRWMGAAEKATVAVSSAVEASLLALLPSLLLPLLPPREGKREGARAFVAGALLAASLVHMLQSAAKAQPAGFDYPYFALFALGAFFLVLIAEDAIASATASSTRQCSRAARDSASPLLTGRAKFTLAALAVLLLLKGMHASTLSKSELTMDSVGAVLSRLFTPALALGLQLYVEDHPFLHSAGAALMLTLSSSFGVLLGLAYTEPNFWTSSVGNGVTGGILLYVAFAEVVGPVFDPKQALSSSSTSDDDSQQSLRQPNSAFMGDESESMMLEKKRSSVRYQQFGLFVLGMLPPFILEISAVVSRDRGGE
jgi:hypothetical protein